MPLHVPRATYLIFIADSLEHNGAFSTKPLHTYALSSLALASRHSQFRRAPSGMTNIVSTNLCIYFVSCIKTPFLALVVVYRAQKATKTNTTAQCKCFPTGRRKHVKLPFICSLRMTPRWCLFKGGGKNTKEKTTPASLLERSS